MEPHYVSMEKYPQVKRYYDEIGAVPEVKASMEVWKVEADKADAALKSVKIIKSHANWFIH